MGDKTLEEKKKKRVSIITILLEAVLLAGICIILYPTVSDWWNDRHASRAIANYVEAVSGLDPEIKEEVLERARAYNAALDTGVHIRLTEEEYTEYEQELNATGNGVMGYIQIPSINVNLPVYHGTEESVLQTAVGHVAGSSLPVGGNTSHSVLSAHRGLPSARLFTDLDELEEGDFFSLNILEDTLLYEVDQVRIVSPEDVGELSIIEGKDYCTLVTCTPYGINTHRILVRGHRVEAITDDVLAITSEAVRIPSYYVIPAVGIPLLFVTLAVMIWYSSRKKSGRSEEELLEELKKRDK